MLTLDLRGVALVRDLTIILFHISLSLISDEAAYAYIDDCGDNRPLGIVVVGMADLQCVHPALSGSVSQQRA